MINPRFLGLLAFCILFVLVVILGISVFSLRQYNQTLQNKLNQTLTNETTQLVNSAGKLIKLPEGEVPAIATVLDKSKLQTNEFFKNAKNGDKILVYQNAKKAILYRPSENKVIEVGPVILENTPTPATPSASQEESVNFRPITVSPTEIPQ